MTTISRLSSSSGNNFLVFLASYYLLFTLLKLTLRSIVCLVTLLPNRQQMRRVQTARKDVPGEYIFLEVQLTRVR